MTEVTKDEIERALARPKSFMFDAWDEFPDMFRTWSLGVMLKCRDSSKGEIRRARAWLNKLKKRVDSKEYAVIRLKHWGYGWVDQLAFHAVDENGEATEAFKAIKEIVMEDRR